MSLNTKLESLPNEIVIAILSSFRTKSLLPLALISHRFYDLILRIVEARLLQACNLSDHTLVLEVFHPSTKFSTPYLFCSHLGSGSAHALADPSTVFSSSSAGGLGKLPDLYAHFRPLQPEVDKSERRPHPAGGFLGQSHNIEKYKTEFVSQDIHLESHELFSQLCTFTNIVKVGPRRGLFRSCVNIGEGLTRVWRKWLAESVEVRAEESVLWADANEHVGLNLGVIEREVEGPVVVGVGEDAPVSYTLEYEELVIRGTQLLLTVEQSIEQEYSASGKAVIIGYWD